MGDEEMSVVIGATNTTRKEDAEGVCWSAGVASELSRTLQQSRAARWQWIGFAPGPPGSGVARVVPGSVGGAALASADGAAWAAAAATGPKDVVFLIDRSNSMHYNKHWEAAQGLLQKMLEGGVSLADFFAVVAVNDKTVRLGTPLQPDKDGDPVVESTLLERGTADAVFRVRAALCEVETGSGSLLVQALRKAVAILVESHAGNVTSTSGCDAHIVVITDGDLRERAQVVTSALQEAASRFAAAAPGRRLHVHTYALGKLVRPWLRSLSCRHDGIAVEIPDAADGAAIEKAAFAWLDFAATERVVSRAMVTSASLMPREATWTDERYLTMDGTGAVVSVPVYSTADGSSKLPKHLVGVVAGAMFLDDLEHNLTDSATYPAARELDAFHTLMLYRGLNPLKMCHSGRFSVLQMQKWRNRSLGYECTYEDMGLSANASQAGTPYVPDDPNAGTWLPSEPSCPDLALNASELWCNTDHSNATLEMLQSAHCCAYPDGTCTLGSACHTLFSLPCCSNSP